MDWQLIAVSIRPCFDGMDDGRPNVLERQKRQITDKLHLLHPSSDLPFSCVHKKVSKKWRI